MHKVYCDILISGAGIVGSSLALRLVQFGFQVILLDSIKSISPINNSKLGLRASAINFFSVQLLRKIGIWEKIQTSFYTKFQKLEVWESYSSKVTFDSALLNLPNMGIVIENNRLQHTLWEKFLDYHHLTFYHPCSLISMYFNGVYWELQLSNHKIVNSLLLIGADGVHSLVRNQSGIGVTGWKYRQFCMSLSLTYSKDQKNTVWQNFTPFGPRGFLPVYNDWGSLMWYDNINYIHKLQNLSRSVLSKKIQKRFSDRLGTIEIHNIIYFSLLRQHAHSYVKEGLALVGDAAHTINPLAGQGINLGLRDVDVLVDVLTRAKNDGGEWNKMKILKNYQNIRWFDNFFMQTGIDLLYMMFSNNTGSIKFMRNTSLMFFEKINLLKKYILKYALGYKR